MSTVNKQIQSANEAICRNIESLADQRQLLSQNLLSQLRNLVEGVAVFLHTNSIHTEFNFPDVKPAIDYVKGKAKLNFLGKFHKLIQISASHYTLDGDTSERLMLKYYEYLYRLRSLLQDTYQLTILHNLEYFPVDLDPSLREYHEKIAAKLRAVHLTLPENSIQGRYYIHKTRPFFVNGSIYYEVTFYPAVNKVSKFDRIIAFTHISATDKYAAKLSLRQDSIEVFGQTMPITIIDEWQVSIRPCEFDNFARLLGIDITARTDSFEYLYLMQKLTENSDNLLDLVDLPDEEYVVFRAKAIAEMKKTHLFPVIDEARRIIRSTSPGHNVLRYIMLRMHNQIIKPQYHYENCEKLSGMKLTYRCMPFDSMPFCTSLPSHNPRYWDLVESLDATDRSHELLVRRVHNNVERHGSLYTPLESLNEFGDFDKLLSTYNNKLYYKHTGRRLKIDKGHVFIQEYEDDTYTIIEKLQKFASTGISGYTQAVEHWLNETSFGIDDQIKKEALKNLFTHSHIALIYGAAGTGKSTMVNHIANYFNDKEKLFLAHTHPATDNLKRRVTAQNSEFRTISSQIYRKASDPDYDLLVIDECSTISNADLIKVLEKTSFKLLVLVGDVYQIEAIQFGNWFRIIRSFIPSTSVFELTTPFRTNNESLLTFWNKTRNLDDDIAEVIARNGYSSVLDKSLFEVQGEDEIILCLNYDGLYGINNINRFLQSSNLNQAVTWHTVTYKIGDPVLFHETERFRPVIYNNLKGKIVRIAPITGGIQFDVELDRPLSEFDVTNNELEWVDGSIVRFSVHGKDTSDEDDDSLNTTVPFQVAYAVSIHKAQGLEYDSVKIVITDANEDNITHSIFYTAVTRARKHLKIFWTPETQQRVLHRLVCSSANQKDVFLLAHRRGLKPIN